MSKLLFEVAILLLFASGNLYLVFFLTAGPKWGKSASLTALVGFIAETLAFGFRWLESYALGTGHVPLVTTYEVTVFFSWCLLLVYLLYERRYETKALGAFIIPLSWLSILLVQLIPGVTDEITPLMPALQSRWLHIHVLSCFLGYAGFAVAMTTSILYLLRMKTEQRFSGFASRLPDLQKLHYISLRAVFLGFIMLTIGIVTGAAWANRTWGRYWGWDPKETWSLITWLIYAAYLHTGWTKKRKGKTMALLAIIGFIAVLITFLGVNYLPWFQGYHTYVD